MIVSHKLISLYSKCERPLTAFFEETGFRTEKLALMEKRSLEEMSVKKFKNSES